MTQKEYHRQWYQKNKKRKDAQNKAWRKKNKKRQKFLERRWYLKYRKRHIKRTTRNNRLRFKTPEGRARRKWYNRDQWKRKTPQQRRDMWKRLKQWRKKHPRKYRAMVLKCLYGISVKEIARLRKKQRNRCAVCQRVFRKRPHIDHNHETGKVRGLLCGPCNSGIGMLNDCPDRLRAAIEYLQK